MDSDDSNNGLVIDEASSSQKSANSTTITATTANGSTANAANEHVNGHDEELHAFQANQSAERAARSPSADQTADATNGQPEKAATSKATHTTHNNHIQRRRESTDIRAKNNNNNMDKKHRKKSAGSEKSPWHGKAQRHDKTKSHHDKTGTPKKIGRKYEFTCGHTKIVADRLAHLEQSETKMLSLSIVKHQFYNMKLYRHNNVLLRSQPGIYPSPAPLPDINFEQLLHWPGISVCISVDHLQIRHSLKANIQRQITFGAEPLIELPLDENCLDTRYITAAPTTRRNPLLAKRPMLDYMPALLEAGSVYDMQASRRSELKTALDLIASDLNAVPFSEVELRSTHSRFVNKYKYVRYFAHETVAMRDLEPAAVREIINPEVNFCIDKCIFSVDNCDEWMNKMEEYLQEMFERRSKLFGDGLRERFKKCITLQCEFCYVSFDGPLGSVSMAAHMKEKHFFAKNWLCTNCKQSWSHVELLSMKWKHDCQTNVM